MLILKMSILTAGTVLCFAPTVTSSSLKRIRRGNKDCLEEVVHLTFDKAQKTCFNEAVTDKTNELADQNYNAAEVEQKFADLLDYYQAERQGNRVVLDSLKTKFEQCFFREARGGLSTKMNEAAFKKKYESVSVARNLEKVNNPYCKAKYAEINVLDKKFVKEKREQWQKLGMFRRAINTAMGNFVTFANPKLELCLKDMGEVTLPQLLCAVEGKEAPILEKKQCYDELMKPIAATAKKTTSNDKQPPKTLIRLGFFSKYVVDHLICPNIDKQYNVKQNLKGAAKIIATWPLAVIFSVVAIPIAAIVLFLAWFFGKCADSNWGFACLGASGAALGAVLGICLLLYSVFGIPWKALTRIFSDDENSNKVNFEEEFKDAAWIRDAFTEMLAAGLRPKDN